MRKRRANYRALILSLKLGFVALVVCLVLANKIDAAQTAPVTSPCSNGIAVSDPLQNPLLVNDCDILLLTLETLISEAGLNWSPSVSILRWEGVTVVGLPPRVTELQVHGDKLSSGHPTSGAIPPELGRLSELTMVDLRQNALTGEIPPELGNLGNLKSLILNGNQLSGAIPDELDGLIKLQGLYLGSNQLTGKIPAALLGLRNLKTLYLPGNKLSGTIPLELRGLDNLNSLYLYQNDLTGSIPAWLGELMNLRVLSLNDNKFAGEIPPELSRLTSLETLQLNHNYLSGIIPSELGKLTSLEELALIDNQFTGEIPPELSNLANLDSLHLSENQLTGEIPVEFGQLTNLAVLGLNGNQLTGAIPAELEGLVWLEKLWLRDNEFSGCIPPSLLDITTNDMGELGLPPCDESQEVGPSHEAVDRCSNGVAVPGQQDAPLLVQDCNILLSVRDALSGGGRTLGWSADSSIFEWEVVSIGGNPARVTVLWIRGDNEGTANLRGSIPPELGGLTGLVSLGLMDNALTGEIPPELGGLVNLRELLLAGNELTGEIPTELGNLVNLEELDLYSNQLTGNIPPELGNLASLKTMQLDRNHLHGDIPADLGRLINLRGLGLSENQLTGEIPASLSRLTNLEWLNLAKNQLTGKIPPELGSLTKLYSLGLNDNQLSGDIPSELGNAIGLIYLSAGGNQLAGIIPPELGQLGELVSLSLPRNKLSGTIPLELGNLSNLRSLHLHNNELTGSIPQELGKLAYLRTLHLPGNKLVGCLPPTLSGLDDPGFQDEGTKCFTVEGAVLTMSTSHLLPNNDLQITGVGDATNGAVSLDGTSITYVHDDSETSKGGFTYFVNDGASAFTKKLTIEVTPVNDPPSPVGDRVSVDEGSSVSIDESSLLINDFDAEIDPLHVAGVGSAINGSVHVDGKSITYVHDGSETTTGGFEYEVSDGADTSTAMVKVDVSPVNDPPELAGDSIEVAEGSTVLIDGSTLLANDLDAENDPLRVTGVGDAFNGSVLLNGGTIAFTHDGSETITGGFTYAVSDGVDTSNAMVIVEVSPVNDPPELAGDSVGVKEGKSVSIDGLTLLENDLDAEHDPLRVTGVGDAVNGSVSFDGGTIAFTHDGSETITGGFTYSVSDGVDTSNAMVIVEVSPVNDPPELAGDSVGVKEGKSVSIDGLTLLENDLDAENDPLRVTGVGDAFNGSVLLNGGTIAFTHDGSETITGGFTYLVSDGVDTSNAMVTVEVSPVNDPPEPAADSIKVDEGSTVLIDGSSLLANDLDAENDPLRVTGVGDAFSGSVLLNGGTIAFTHDGSETTTGGFTYSVSDGVDTSNAMVTVEVSPVNDPPELAGDSVGVKEGKSVSIDGLTLLENDLDAENDPLRVTGVGDAVNGSVLLDGGTIAFTHDGSETITGGFTYFVSDGVDTSNAMVTVEVSPVNDPPEPAADSIKVDEGSTVLIDGSTLLANDLDAENDPLRVTGVGDAFNGSVLLNGGTIAFTHDGSETTTGGFTYSVSDGVDTSNAMVTVEVSPVNDPPEPTADSIEVDEGSTVLIDGSTLLANDLDAENDPLRVTAVGEAVNGSVSLDGNTITYTHDRSETLDGSFAYIVSDGTDSDSSLVTLTVTPTDDPPAWLFVWVALGIVLAAVLVFATIRLRRRG